MPDHQPLIRLEWQAAADLIHAAQQIVIVTHQNPDGDAIGSLCGLGLALREQGKTVILAVDGGITPYLRFVPGSETVLASLDNPPADLVISTDASDLARTGKVGAAVWGLLVPKLVIDHHNTNPLFGDVHILHSDFVSATEAVLRLLDFLGWPLSAPVATALAVGFMTDTITFRVGPVVPETLEQVARLMRAGADLRQVINQMLIRSEPGQLELLGRGLAGMKIEDHVGWTSLRLTDFQEVGLSLAEKPELSTTLLSDTRVYIGAFFLETETGDVRVSLRGKEGFAVAPVAAQFGGGGHTLAAGLTLPQMSLEAAQATLIPALKAAVARGLGI